MRFLGLLLFSFVLASGTFGATVLATYDGSAVPSSLGWTHSSANTHVTGQNLTDEGRSVWQLTDPGLGGSSPVNHQYYYRSVTPTSHALMMTQGWQLTAVVKVPTDTPTSQVVWGLDRNIWLAYIHINPDNLSRTLYGLMIGRDSLGNATLQGYNTSGSKVVGTGYHEYSIRYAAATSTAGIYIDGVYWKDLTPGVLAGVGGQMVYWGDNNSQTSPIAGRSANWDFVELSVVPEPNTVGLLAIGVLGILLWTRNRQNQIV